MSSIPDIGDQPIEHDPTGVRALLGDLPDPGPMPAHLVARIEAALALEATQARLDPESGTSGDAHAGTVIPFAADEATRDDGILRGQTRQERRRVVLPWLAAAAAAGIVTVAGTNLLHDNGPSIAAAFGGRDSASSAMSSSSSGEALTSGATPNTLKGADGSAGGGAPAVSVQRSGASYTSAGLAQQVVTLHDATPSTLSPTAAESPATGPLGTPLAARDCAVKHGVDPADPLTVDLANIDGTPGIVVVATHGAERTAYAFSMSCTVLAGPVSVP